MVYTFIPAPGKSTGGAMEVPFDMKLATCRLCRRIFTSSGSVTCPECMEHLGSCFRLICGYLNNNLKVEVDARALSETLDIDIRYVQALIEMGYLERNASGDAAGETETKQGLVGKLRASAAKSDGTPKESSAGMYARNKYGDKGKRRK